MENELFPRELVSDVPRVTMIGDERVQVEQHRGLLAYQPEKVVFRLAKGSMTVTGEALRFRLYTATEAILYGHVDSVIVGAEGERS